MDFEQLQQIYEKRAKEITEISIKRNYVQNEVGILTSYFDNLQIWLRQQQTNIVVAEKDKELF